METVSSSLRSLADIDCVVLEKTDCPVQDAESHIYASVKQKLKIKKVISLSLVILRHKITQRVIIIIIIKYMYEENYTCSG